MGTCGPPIPSQCVTVTVPLGLGFVVVTFYQIAERMPGRVTDQREHDYKAEEERNEAEQHRAGNQCCP